MIAPLKINGIDYVGEVVVEQRPNRQGFYLHEVEIKEKLADEFKPPHSREHTHRLFLGCRQSGQAGFCSGQKQRKLSDKGVIYLTEKYK